MALINSRSLLGRFATRYALPITVLVLAICGAGGYSASHMGSSLFPETNFPRVAIMVRNGQMAADDMMARVTRPIEEAVKDVPGCKMIKSATGRGSAAIDVFFDWSVDTVQSELYVDSRLAALRDRLPQGTEPTVYRMTFSVFPIIGISLTSAKHNLTDLWETARYTIQPQLLRIPGVARVRLVGGNPPEYRVVADPAELAAHSLTLERVAAALHRNNVSEPAGRFEKAGEMFSLQVDGRANSAESIGNFSIPTADGQSVPLRDVAKVERSSEPMLSTVTAEGTNAVLLNIYSEPNGSTLQIAEELKSQLEAIRPQLPGDMKLAYYYDQSLLVRDSGRSVWEAIVFGLALSVAILFLFLRNWGTTLVATTVIPVTILSTIAVMKLGGLTFNLMTLGGIAAAIGLVIDDAIVVVETIHTKLAAGVSRIDAVQTGIAEILPPLLGSTLTPVVVFIPLAFLQGIWGVFFRALAITMVVALVMSLVLSLTFVPSLATWLSAAARKTKHAEGGPLFRGLVRGYEFLVRSALRFRWITVGLSAAALAGAAILFSHLDSDFLPDLDEGGFVIDYVAPPGTAPSEVNRQLEQAESLLRKVPEVESYSRRSGAALGLHIVEPNTGDFLVKLKSARQRRTDAVLDEVGKEFRASVPGLHFEFEGILTDLIGDLTWSDRPIEIKVFSSNKAELIQRATAIEQKIKQIPGIIDTFSGIVYTGKAMSVHVRQADAHAAGLDTADVAGIAQAALTGQIVSSVMENTREIGVRLVTDPTKTDPLHLRVLPIAIPSGRTIPLSQVADVIETPEQLELEREDLRQDIAVTARLEDRDLGGAMADVRRVLGGDPTLPPGSIAYGGLYEQQQESSRQLTIVLAIAVLLVFLVAIVEFRSLSAPVAIVFGAVLSVLGIVVALYLTGTTLNIIAYLGAIIGMGIVHKNGILMLDHVEHLHRSGLSMHDALVQAGRRRLRPVLMTSLAAALGMLPLAYGIGSGADMLRPLAITVIGAVCISVLLSLVATPAAYLLILDVKSFILRSSRVGSSR